jgi:uncharacterized protein (TIGR02145 family)
MSLLLKTIVLLVLFATVVFGTPGSGGKPRCEITSNNNTAKVPQKNTNAADFKTVKMPDGKEWMAENLNIEMGNSICYDNKEENCKQCGRLYDWETAVKACPEGWHLPTAKEWSALAVAAGGKEIAGAAFKSKKSWTKFSGKSGNGTDKYGFSVFPCGFRYVCSGFFGYGFYAFFWSITESEIYGAESNAVGRYLHSGEIKITGDEYNKSSMRSVRCLRD